MISLELKELLIEAASRYEIADFIPKDPVQFPHRYKMKRDIEIAGLVTALISFGNRKQIIGKADKLCLMMGKSPLEYVKERVFEKDFSYDDNSSFYRMISHANFRDIFEKLYEVYDNAESMEEYVLSFNGNAMEKMCAFLEVSPKSPQKKINMFLRWMVRQNSPVDFGLWKKFDSADLIIPLDTHVAHMAKVYGIVEKEVYTLSSAKRITNALSEVFPGDPVRGDFALFGVGVENTEPVNS